MVDMIIDGGESDVVLGSTVVGIGIEGRPHVIRPGVIELEFQNEQQVP
jgi:tRNA A37 threonylcarbamoyladenosine synthetase subunit TsaC/SUA5/YrdC